MTKKNRREKITVASDTSTETRIESGSKEVQPVEATPTPSQALPLEFKFRQADNFVSIYANNAFFSPATIWDFRVVFGEITGAQDKNLLVENRVSVTMPLAVAKMLALGIERNLQEYQKATGKTVDLPEITFAVGPGGARLAGPAPAPREPREKE